MPTSWITVKRPSFFWQAQSSFTTQCYSLGLNWQPPLHKLFCHKHRAALPHNARVWVWTGNPLYTSPSATNTEQLYPTMLQSGSELAIPSTQALLPQAQSSFTPQCYSLGLNWQPPLHKLFCHKHRAALPHNARVWVWTGNPLYTSSSATSTEQHYPTMPESGSELATPSTQALLPQIQSSNTPQCQSLGLNWQPSLHKPFCHKHRAVFQSQHLMVIHLGTVESINIHDQLHYIFDLWTLFMDLLTKIKKSHSKHLSFPPLHLLLWYWLFAFAAQWKHLIGCQ